MSRKIETTVQNLSELSLREPKKAILSRVKYALPGGIKISKWLAIYYDNPLKEKEKQKKTIISPQTSTV